jgi:sterol desaturase/sphingolipid hydroxylase (fatty acid hydroxylase superfamily)
MFSLVDVLIDAVWVLGLAGTLATFSYIDWYRRCRNWRWRDAWNRPKMLVPLSLSLAVFCLGVALNGFTAYQPAPIWETAIWALMTLLFAAQTVIYWRHARGHGWDEPLDGPSSAGTSTGQDESTSANGM